MTRSLDLPALLDHLRATKGPIRLPRTGRPSWKDEPLHADAFGADPELYALSALDEQALPAQQSRVLLQILGSSRSGASAATRAILDRVAAVLCAALPADDVLTVFLALRRTRANHKHGTRTMLRYLFNHPCLDDLAMRRRPALVDSLEHALGRDTIRGFAKSLAGPGATPRDPAFLREAEDGPKARAVVAWLFGGGAKRPLGNPCYESANTALAEIGAKKAPKTVDATNRGDIASTLVNIYRGGPTRDLTQALSRYVTRAAEAMPRYGGTVGVVLDASGSTRGYGEREFCCIAQSQALRLVLEACCRRTVVRVAGGRGDPPVPEGVTDLASAVLEVAEANPEMIAVLTDGYENLRPGDLQRVSEALDVPVVLCHSKFTEKDDLALRRPASLREVEFWHEEDFRRVVLALFSMAGGASSRELMMRDLSARLERLEQEVKSWVS